MTDFINKNYIYMKKFLVILIFLSGCSIIPQIESKYINVENSYLKIPANFSTFSSKELLLAQNSDEIDPESIKIIGFSEKNIVTSVMKASNNLMGIMLKASIPNDLDSVNDKNVVITNLSELLLSGDAKLIKPFTKIEKFSGISENSVIELPDSDGKTLKIFHETITDKNRKNIYVLIIGCSPQCYTRNENNILTLNKTWKVEINE
jgi:hypothetical protein